MYKNSGKKSIPHREQPKQIKEMKIADSERPLCPLVQVQKIFTFVLKPPATSICLSSSVHKSA